MHNCKKYAGVRAQDGAEREERRETGIEGGREVGRQGALVQKANISAFSSTVSQNFLL